MTFVAYLFEFVDGTRVNASAFVDQVTGGRRLAAIDVAWCGSQLHCGFGD